jgi:hypothetical protein
MNTPHLIIMRAIAAITLFVLSMGASLQAVPPNPTTTDAAIDRGLAFLAKDALAWKAQHQCVSCHHASLVVWAMREAKHSGRPVDEPVLTELTQGLAEAGDGKSSVPRPAGIPKECEP